MTHITNSKYNQSNVQFMRQSKSYCNLNSIVLLLFADLLFYVARVYVKISIEIGHLERHYLLFKKSRNARCRVSYHALLAIGSLDSLGC